MNRREKGEKITREMMGPEMSERLLASAASGTFGSSIAGYAIDQTAGCFDSVDQLENDMVNFDEVKHEHVMRAIREYDELGPDGFFAKHGFAPTTTYDLLSEQRKYPPKAILGTAYEFATGRKLRSTDFEGGKSGAVKVLEGLGFTVRAK